MDPAVAAALEQVKTIGNYEVWYVRYILYAVLQEDFHKQFLEALIKTGEGDTKEFQTMLDRALDSDPDEVTIVVKTNEDGTRHRISTIANQIQMQVFPANIAVVNQQVVVGNSPRAQLLVQKIAENYLATKYGINEAGAFDELEMKHLYINAGSALACRAAQCQGINTILALRLRDSIEDLKEVNLCCISNPKLGHVFVMVKTKDDKYFYADSWTLPVGVIEVSKETYTKIVNGLAMSVPIGKVKGGHQKAVETYRKQCLAFLGWDATSCEGDRKKLTTDTRCVPKTWIYKALSDETIQDFNSMAVNLKKWYKYQQTKRLGGFKSESEELAAKRACYYKKEPSHMPQLKRWTAEDIVDLLKTLKVPEKKVHVRGASIDSLYDVMGPVDDNIAQKDSLDINITDRRSRSHQTKKRYYSKGVKTEDSILSILEKDVNNGQQLIESLEEHMEDLQIQVKEQKQIVGKKQAEVRNRLKFLERKERNQKSAMYTPSATKLEARRKNYNAAHLLNDDDKIFWT